MAALDCNRANQSAVLKETKTTFSSSSSSLSHSSSDAPARLRFRELELLLLLPPPPPPLLLADERDRDFALFGEAAGAEVRCRLRGGCIEASLAEELEPEPDTTGAAAAGGEAAIGFAAGAGAGGLAGEAAEEDALGCVRATAAGAASGSDFDAGGSASGDKSIGTGFSGEWSTAGLLAAAAAAVCASAGEAASLWLEDVGCCAAAASGLCKLALLATGCVAASGADACTLLLAAFSVFATPFELDAALTVLLDAADAAEDGADSTWPLALAAALCADGNAAPADRASSSGLSSFAEAEPLFAILDLVREPFPLGRTCRASLSSCTTCSGRSPSSSSTEARSSAAREKAMSRRAGKRKCTHLHLATRARRGSKLRCVWVCHPEQDSTTSRAARERKTFARLFSTCAKSIGVSAVVFDAMPNAHRRSLEVEKSHRCDFHAFDPQRISANV